MTDYIATSQVIQKFLDKNDITFEVDEFAPVVYKAAFAPNGIDVRSERAIADCFLICPYYGPGGADNSLKALRAWAKKNGWRLTQSNSRAHEQQLAWSLTRWDDKVRKYIYATKPVWSYGKTDGIALHDLLYKLAKEEK